MTHYAIKVCGLWFLKLDQASTLSENINPHLFDTEEQAREFADSIGLRNYIVEEFTYE